LKEGIFLEVEKKFNKKKYKKQVNADIGLLLLAKHGK